MVRESWKLFEFAPKPDPNDVRKEWENVDKRELQPLNDLLTLEDLRKLRVHSSQDASTSEPGVAAPPLRSTLPKLRLPARSKATSQAGAAAPGALRDGGGSPDGDSDASSADDSPSTTGRAERQAHNTPAGSTGGAGARGKWAPLQAARAQLAVDKPGLLNRMEEAVENCRISRANRNYRLNSLGVFENDTNEVRARSMLRVQMHKELSTTSMRLPQQQKELKLERPDDSLNARLEKMYVRVLKSLDDAPAARVRNNNTTMGRRDKRISYYNSLSINVPGARPSMGGGTLFSPGPGTATSPGADGSSPGPFRSPGAHYELNDGMDVVPGARPSMGGGSPSLGATSRAGSRSGNGRNTSMSSRTLGAESTNGRRRSLFGGLSNLGSTRGAPKVPGSPGPLGLKSPGAASHTSGHARFDWIRTSLPPEVAAAHIEHLSTLTEQHINRYHSEVIAAQARVVAESGLQSAAEAAAKAIAEQEAAAAAALAAEQEQYKGMGSHSLVGITEPAAEEMLPPRSAMRHLPSTASALLAAGPDVLEEALKHHLLGDGSGGDEEMKEVKEATRQMQVSTSIPELISAALSHVDTMATELQVFKESLPKEPVKAQARRSRKPSVPLTRPGAQGATTSTAPSAATTRPPSQADKASTALPQMSQLSLIRQAEGAYAAGMDDGEEGDGEYADWEGGEAAEGGQGEVRSAAAPALSPNVSPRPALSTAPPPVINHTPITAKRLAALVEKIETACTPSALATLHLPSLPNLPRAPSASLHIQARLERVWNALLVPLTMRLDTVLVYTHRDRSGQMEQALAAWEKAAVAVVAREEALIGLSALQAGVEEGRVGLLSVSVVERQCVELMQLSAIVEEAGRILKQQHGLDLTYDGAPYPGDDTAVSTQQMVAFFEWLRDVPNLRLLN